MKGISSVAGVQDGYSVPSGGGEQEDCVCVCVCVCVGGGGGGEIMAQRLLYKSAAVAHTLCVCGTCNITSRNMTIRLSENV